MNLIVESTIHVAGPFPTVGLNNNIALATTSYTPPTPAATFTEIIDGAMPVLIEALQNVSDSDPPPLDGDEVEIVWSFGTNTQAPTQRNPQNMQRPGSNPLGEIVSIRRTRFEWGRPFDNHYSHVEVMAGLILHTIWRQIWDLHMKAFDDYSEDLKILKFTVSFFNLSAWRRFRALQRAEQLQVSGGCLPAGTKNRRLFKDGLFVFSSKSFEVNDCIVVSILRSILPTTERVTKTKVSSCMGQIDSVARLGGHQWTRGEPFPYVKVDLLTEIFKCSIIVRGKGQLTPSGSYEHPIIREVHYPGNDKVAKILLLDGHYWTIRSEEVAIQSCRYCGNEQLDGHECPPKKKCKSCGVEYRRQHDRKSCAERTSYNTDKVQTKERVAKAKDIFVSKEDLDQFICIFDFETMPIDGVHMVYAAGWTYLDDTTNKVHFSYGKDALEEFMRDVLDRTQEIREHKKSLKKARKEHTAKKRRVNAPNPNEEIELSASEKLVKRFKGYTLAGFNSSGFDNFFVMQELIRLGYTPEYAISNGSLLKMTVKKEIRVFDCYRFTSASLRASCKAFGLVNEKGDFPHKFMTGWDILDYVGPAPGLDQYYQRPSGDDQITEELADVGNPRWNLKEKLLYYLEKDVLTTKELFIKLTDFFFTEFKVDVSQYMTLSSLAYAIWLNTICKIKHDEELPPSFQDAPEERLDKDEMHFPSEEEWTDIRSAVYGGRCFPTKRFFVSKHYKDLVEGRMTWDQLHSDYLLHMDVVSLYPTAMKNYDYPVGESRRVFPGDPRLTRWTNRVEPLPLGIYEVSIACNENLFIPVLPEKSNGRLMWDLRSKEDVWYTNIDIENAWACGYTVSFKSGLIWRKKAKIFANYINMVFKIKKEGDETKNEVKRGMGKLMMNALYGKQLQLPIVERSVIVRSNAQYMSFTETYEVNEIHWLPDNSAVIVKGTTENLNRAIEKPSQNGAFVLSYSRRVMEEYVTKLDRSRLTDYEQSIKNSFFYTDTDSLHMEVYSEERERQLEELMGKDLGQLDNDFKDGGKIIKAWYLFPKTWACVYIARDNSIVTKMKGKGMPAKGRVIEDYDRALIGEDTTPFTFDKLSKVADRDTYQGQTVEPFSILSKTMTKRLVKAGTPKNKGRRFERGEEVLSHPYTDESLHDNELFESLE